MSKGTVRIHGHSYELKHIELSVRLYAKESSYQACYKKYSYIIISKRKFNEISRKKKRLIND